MVSLFSPSNVTVQGRDSLLVSVPGWFVLAARRLWGMAIVSALIVATIFLVNLSYPVWHGGWSTGPRLLTFNEHSHLEGEDLTYR